MIINPNIAVIEALPGVGGDESKIWIRNFYYLMPATAKDTVSNTYIWMKISSG